MLGVLAVATAAVMVLIAALQPRRPTSTPYQRSHDQAPKLDEQRARYYADIITMRTLVTALLVVVVSALTVASWGWLWGVVVALVVALQYQSLARLPFIQRFVQKHYDKLEPRILHALSRGGIVLKLLRGIPLQEASSQIASKEELLHVIEQSRDIISHDELRAIKGVTQFGDKIVRDFMTPRSVIDSITTEEHVGPLLLDKLHNTGHSRFPVVVNDLDHVVGMLHIRELLTIHGGSNSHTVEEVMNKSVYYIHEDQTLQHALAAFIKARSHLFVVVNEYRETVGLLSLEDVIEQLIGREIMDEYDLHDDLRAVASRNPHGNNKTSKTAKDV